MSIEIKAIGIEFSFQIQGKKNQDRVKFYRKLYGHRRYSNYGKYVYVEEGLLSGIPYLKPAKSSIIVSMENKKKVENFLKKEDIEFGERIVLLKKDEAEFIGSGEIPEGWDKNYGELMKKDNLVFRFDF